MVKLHLGNGCVYLAGYVNINLSIPGYSFLTTERPDLVKENMTTLENYYKKPWSPVPRETTCVCDIYGDMTDLPFADNSVEEILCIQSFEHLSRREAAQALDCWYRILTPSGLLHIDVPDFEESVRLLLKEPEEDKKELYYRWVYGSQKNEGDFHKDGYSLLKLKRLLVSHGFMKIRQINENLHPYPAIIMEANKPDA